MADEQDPLNALNAKLARPEDRVDAMQSLVSLCLDKEYTPDTVASSSTIMARAAAHPIFKTLIHSLLFDTGNMLFPLGLRCFLAIIPYAPEVVTPHIPLVMIVLGRAASWRDRPFVDHDSISRDGDAVTRTPLPNPSLGWQVETRAMEVQTPLPETLKPQSITRLLFTAVYGGWPSNVIAFIRDPVAYIEKKEIEPMYNVPWEDIWAPGILASRSAPLLRDFHLHPALCSFTSGQELMDHKRWDKFDPAKFITRSHMLSLSDDPGAKADLFAEQATATIQELLQAPEPPAESSVAKTQELTGDTTTDVSRLQREIQLLRLEAQFTNRIRKLYLYRECYTWHMR